MQTSVKSAIRNRRGHRPLSADIAGSDTVIASYNVHKCVGLDKIFNPERIVNVISELNADIFGLQEQENNLIMAYFKVRNNIDVPPLEAVTVIDNAPKQLELKLEQSDDEDHDYSWNSSPSL